MKEWPLIGVGAAKMHNENDKIFKTGGVIQKERAGTFFSAFRVAPEVKKAPAPAPAPAAVSAPVPKAAPPVAPPVPAASAPSEDVIRLFQQHISELEKRLYDTQEKALMFSIELKTREENQRQSVRQAEEVFENLRVGQRAMEQDKKMSERLAQLESISSRLAAAQTAETAGRQGAGKDSMQAALALLSDRLGAIESRLSSMETGIKEVSEKAALEKDLNARNNKEVSEKINSGGDLSERRYKELSEKIESANKVHERRHAEFLGKMESVNKINERKYEELSGKMESANKVHQRSHATTEERLSCVEKNAVLREYIDKKFSGYEAAMKRMGGAVVEICQKICKVEGGQQALQRDQARVSESNKVYGAIVEEMQLQFEKMYVVFKQIGKSF